MTTSAILHIGDAFAEIGLAKNQAVINGRRIPLGREPIARIISNYLQENCKETLTEFIFSSRASQATLRKRHGGSCAFLVTAGFEHWLEMSRPARQNHFTMFAERTSSIIEPTLVFGISERINKSGHCEKQVQTSDLEFLVEKLKMNNVQEVAVGFLHANLNPQNENLVGQFLRDHGFHVQLSNTWSFSDYEVSRWWSTFTNAYLTQRHQQILTEVQTALNETGHQSAKLGLLLEGGVGDPQGSSAPLHSFFGDFTALDKWRQKMGAQSMLFLGLEDFFVLDGRWGERRQWRTDFGLLAVSHRGCLRSDVQPTKLIDKSFWGEIICGPIENGFEPGPMCLGKGTKPHLLDVLWLQGRLEGIVGLSERLVEKNKSRVGEALMALAKGEGGTGFHGLAGLAAELEEKTVRQMFAEIKQGTSDILLCGPLAVALEPVVSRVAHVMGVRLHKVNEPMAYLAALATFTGSEGQA